VPREDDIGCAAGRIGIEVTSSIEGVAAASERSV
jgi:hypothetical protein